MMQPPDPIELSVDRIRAAVRGLWRSACAGLLIALLWNWTAISDWGLLWQSQRASFIGLGVVYLVLAMSGLILLVPALRWLLLAAWPTRVGIEITPERITMRLGPFGGGVYDWSRIRMTLEPEVDPDVLEMLPDDAFVPRMFHPECEEDMARRIQVFSGLEAERVTALLRPLLRWRTNTAGNPTA
ncbi:MAG: hypothetical protein ACE5EC_07870 [Phycisphaerae bacterium]